MSIYISPLTSDTTVHILEYENYAGLDSALSQLKTHPVRLTILYPESASSFPCLPQTLPAVLSQSILPNLHSRHHQIMSEFAFWPSSPPRNEGGIFEMRSYTLVPGTLLEWEGAWRRGIDARRKFVEPAGAWFAQVGHLHEVHHLWQYPNLAERKATREQAWNVGGWSETVQQVSQLYSSLCVQRSLITFFSIDRQSNLLNR